MAFSLGKIRYSLLLRFGNIFRRLDTLYNLWPARLLYNVLRWLWEVVSPSKVYHIVSFSEYASNHSITKIPLKSNRVGYAANAVIIGKEGKQIIKEIALPDLNLYYVEDVLIHHRSDFIVNLKEHLAVNDYCATKNDENKGYEDAWYYWQGGKVVILRTSKCKKQLKSAIMLTDKYSFNYYHNMYDNLIRLCVLEECNNLIPSDVPIVLDEEITKVPSFKRISEMLLEDIKRPIVLAKKEDVFSIGGVYYIGSVNSLVPLHRDYTKGIMEDYVFDKFYISKMRSKLLKFRDVREEQPKRIFISRKNTTHRNFNEDELFPILQPYGFEKVAPEELTFEQQMTLFHNAEMIVSGSGAALTNLLFTSQNCMIICLYRNSPYIPAVFTVPAYFNGAKMFYFQSSRGEGEVKAHSNFTIDVKQFEQFARDCIAPTMKPS